MYAPMSLENEVKDSIAYFEKHSRGIDCNRENIILTGGVAPALCAVHYALLDKGDEVISFDPAHYLGFPTSYWAYFNAKVVACRSIEQEGWIPDIDDLRKKINTRTKAIFLNNPNNPTGAIYDEKTIKSIVNIAGEHDLLLIGDEIYSLITFDKAKAPSVASIAGDVPAIIMNGMSKAFMRTGWRVGYIIFHDPQGRAENFIATVKKISTAYGHPSWKAISTPILFAALKAFRSSLDALKHMIKELEIRRNFTLKCFKEIKSLSCVKPKGALYAFPKVNLIPEIWKTDIDFLMDFLNEEQILFNPGSQYGRLGVGHFRTLLMPNIDTLRDIYSRLGRFIDRHTSV
jgi:aspartate/methionine/tyrosine aminotransferase